METPLNVTSAWQRLLRQSWLSPSSVPASNWQAALEESATDAGVTLPMLYRSEAFAEDLFDSHPQPA